MEVVARGVDRRTADRMEETLVAVPVVISGGDHGHH
jgi:hypothetical protein